MAEPFKTDLFRVKSAAIDFLQYELAEMIKDYDSCIMIGGRKVAATVEFKDGFVSVDVETPVKYL